MAQRNTRSKTDHPLFGPPSLLPQTHLPTLGDALRLVLYYKSESEQIHRFADKATAVKQAALDIDSLWTKAIGDRVTVPLISEKAIITKL